MQLETIDVSNLEVVGNPYDLRRDLDTFMEYVINRQVKRSVRGNQIPKAEAKRLAKLMSMPMVIKEVEGQGCSPWLDELDDLALRMGWISYDTEGEYIGYTSQEPSFTDNYIEADPKKYNNFLAMPLQKQEDALLKALMDDYSYSNNEFFRVGLLGRLTAFDYSGCAVGVVPDINFSKIRQFLINQLGRCQSNVWHSLDSFIHFLESHHPYFLIPENPKQKYYGKTVPDRYNNFKERKVDDYTSLPISSKDSDGFRRVEGRYVERFLENLPLTLGYLELAYGEKEGDVLPELGQIKGFKINDFCSKAINKTLHEPEVTVEPNFEIQVESVIYPAGILRKLAPLTDCKAIGTITTLRLNRKKVATAIAENEKLDVKQVLKKLSGRELPQNVSIELEEWAGQADAFTLYSGFGLLESDKALPEHEEYSFEKIDKGIDLVNNPDELFQKLENAEHIPLLVSHGKKQLHPMPDNAKTRLFTKTVKKRPAKNKEKLVLKRSTEISLFFPDRQKFEIFRKVLTDARCVFQPDSEALAIRYQSDDQKTIEAAVKSLKNKYQIQIQDIVK